MSEGARSHFVAAPDGLKLHVRTWGSRGSSGLPVVCLPGLARTSVDFIALAESLAGSSREVFALDYRGRGRSEYDRNPGNYSVPVELADLVAVLTAMEVPPAVFVGTSRGGILAMLLATVRPTAIAGVVLNDIGPVIEAKGLVRIKSYVGRLPPPKSFEDGAELLRRLFDAQFPKLGPGDWIAFARRTFSERHGSLLPSYDPHLAKALQGIDLERALPPLWKEFDALAAVPVMVIRGTNSDILSAATVEAMRARRPDLETLEVADQGHAPFLIEDDVIARVASFRRRLRTSRSR